MVQGRSEEGKVVVRKVGNVVFEVPKQGSMRVPLKIFASEKLMEHLQKDKSLQQGVNVASLPGIQKQAIMMSDAHQGYGFPIGGVAAFDEKEGIITPGGIGFDINCGVRVLTSSLTEEEVFPRIKELLDAIFRNVPAGVGGRSDLRLSDEELDRVLKEGIDWAVEKGYATEEDRAHCEEHGRMPEADPRFVSPRAKSRGRKQLGTLGAGNHFLEVQAVDTIYEEDVASVFGLEKEGQVVVMIHSGSRGLGHQVCSDFLRRMEETFLDIMERLPEKDLIYAPLSHPIAREYYKAMSAAANFGWCNRQLMTFKVREAFRDVFGKGVSLRLLYDVAHNIAKLEEHDVGGARRKVYVHRKGATRGFGPGHAEVPEAYRKVGQPILIPGSMGTASYVLVGTDEAMAETFGSTPHGAGRVMSRHAANQQFRGEQIKQELEKRSIFIKSASWRGITEEAPAVYKDIDEVIRVAKEAGIGKPVARLRPLGVVKG
ncbi:RtcB family protein [Candidatus Woesearchaeota archaeon]|nr:MAG: RtcB family protein [Candidatus Woesearchaeota archaeon]